MYTTIRSGPGHTPMFTCTVELAGRIFTGNPGKTKKQAQKNAAMAAWSELKHCEYFLAFLPPSVSYYIISSYLLVDAYIYLFFLRKVDAYVLLFFAKSSCICSY